MSQTTDPVPEIVHGASAPDSVSALRQRSIPTLVDQQVNCPLFRVIPPEIRNNIFALALTDYEEPSDDKQYEKNSCWSRPSYASPRRTDTELLRTCRAIYNEAWFLPFTMKEHTHWITAPDRAPPHYPVGRWGRAFKTTVEEIREQRKEPSVEIESLRIFTQMYKLEGEDVVRFLESVPDLAFRRLCITIRHADFWHWEEDAPLRFEGFWIPKVCRALPSSVREVVIEMETVKRKKHQLDQIANQMTKRWHFRNKDGVRLFADSTDNSHQVSGWQGTSSWHNKRWVRDESSEGVIDYYVGAVRFRPQHVIEKAGGQLSEEALEAAKSDTFFSTNRLKLHLPNERPMTQSKPYVVTRTSDMPERRGRYPQGARSRRSRQSAGASSHNDTQAS